MHYLLFYTVADDDITRRPAFRKVHLEYALKSVARSPIRPTAQRCCFAVIPPWPPGASPKTIPT